jgi:hypothetical protein
VYIAYEFVPGRTYREALRAGELPDAAAIEACAQICEALAHAHANGILHRDVKPSNVLLGDGADVHAKLLDFGLAQMAEAETLTAQGDVPGTLAYISPERLAGDESTAAADVWAVGVMLWEALSGRHPFWQSSMLGTARAIGEGAPRLETLRPDLPKPLLELVDRSLSLAPAHRPTAAELAHALRGAGAPRRATRRRGTTLALPVEATRLGAAALAAAFAGWTASALPFFPHGFAGLIAAAVAGLTAFRTRLGTALALAVPILPLGNISLGLAVLYTALALAWLALCWREPRGALLAALGPVLVPIGLAPLATVGLQAPARRAAQAAGAVLVAGLVAGIRGASLPLTGDASPLGLGVAGANDPLDVAGTLARALYAHPALLLEAAVFAAVAVALPYARGRWRAAALGSSFLVFGVLAVPSVTAWPLVVAAWVTAAAITWASERVA